MRYLERLTNIAVLVGIIVFLAVVTRNEFWPKIQSTGKTQVITSQALVGKQIALPGIVYPTARPSLVLVASTTCHYCKDSLPFYKRLSMEIKSKADFIAVLPQKQMEAEQYIADANVAVTRTVSADLGGIGVRATPTLLLVDDNGKVRDAWIGLQNEGQQETIRQAVLQSAAQSTNVNR